MAHSKLVFGVWLALCGSHTLRVMGGEAPAWPARAGMEKPDPGIHASEPRILSLEHARTLYEHTIDWSDDPATQQLRLEAVGRIEAWVDRYLDGADAPERRLILSALKALAVPLPVFRRLWGIDASR